MLTLSTKVDLRPLVKLIHPQGTIGSCTACSALTAIELLLSSAGKFQYLSRLYVYYMTRKLSNRINKTGASLKDTFMSLSIYGVPPESVWPYRKALQNIEPPKSVIDTAILNKNIKYEIVNIDVTIFKQYIHSKLPIIIGFATGKLFWKISGRIDLQRYSPVNNVDNLQSTGHAVVIVGYDDALCGGSFIIANSLGPSWGDRGFGIYPYSCIVDIGEAYTIKSFNGITIN